MATYLNNTLNFDLSVDANYQSVHGALDTQIQGLGGWTYVSQTGDSDPSAATAGSNDTYPSWRVYSTTVGGQTFYLRLDFGHSANGPSIKFQIGSSVNGSGTLTGNTSTQQTLTAPSNMVGTSRILHIAQATGRLAVMMVKDTSYNDYESWWMSIHVDVDSSGAGANTGIQWFACSNAGKKAQATPASGTVPTARTRIPCNLDNVADQTLGTHVMTDHPFLNTESGGLYPTPAMAVGGTSNSTKGTTTTLTLYGSSRTFLVTGHVSPDGNSSNLRLMMLYE